MYIINSFLLPGQILLESPMSPEVKSAMFSYDGLRIITASMDGTARVSWAQNLQGRWSFCACSQFGHGRMMMMMMRRMMMRRRRRRKRTIMRTLWACNSVSPYWHHGIVEIQQLSKSFIPFYPGSSIGIVDTSVPRFGMWIPVTAFRYCKDMPR